MFCHGGEIFNEAFLDAVNISDLLNGSSFCYDSINFIHYSSLIVGIPTLVFSVAAILSFYEIWRNRTDGIGNIFIAISIIDFCHGLLCIEKFFFLQYATVYTFYNSIFSYYYDWITWGLIDTSWAIKLFLNIYKIYRALKPDAESSFSKKTSLVIITSCAVVVIAETTIVGHFRSITPYTIPVATFQIMLTIISSIVVFCLVACKPTQDQYKGQNSKLVAWMTFLNCLTSLIFTSPMMYGDLSCLPGSYQTPDLEPACFLPLVKFISYFESLFYSVFLMQSKVIRAHLKRFVMGDKKGDETMPLLPETSG